MLACGPSQALFLDEDDLHPHLHVLEALISHAVAVEIDVPAVRRDDEPVARLREERCHPPARRLLMALDLSPLPAGIGLDSFQGGVEGKVDRPVQVLVGLPPDDNVLAGQGEVDPRVVDKPAVAVPVGNLQQDPAAHHVAMELVEFFRFFQDEGFDFAGELEITGRDLQRDSCHGCSLLM